MMNKDAAESLKLSMAVMESYRTGSITPILKEELKYRIQSRRLSEGKDEMEVELNPVKTKNQPLRPDEIERQKRRKEQNKRAAVKFREKRKIEEQRLKGTVETLLKRNRDLREMVKKLEEEKNTLQSLVLSVFQKTVGLTDKIVRMTNE